MTSAPDEMPDPPKNSWCHVEIPSSDPVKAEEFYAAVFGWEFQRLPEMDYTLYQTPGGIGGGIMKRPDGMPPGLLNYINVEEIEPYLSKIGESGGKVIQPVTEIPTVGWFAVVTDPDGNAFALWKRNPVGPCGG
jgi:uncharacterized protein